MSRFKWTRSLCLVLVLALPLSACDAAAPEKTAAATTTAAAPDAPTATAATTGPGESTPDADIERMAAVEEPSGDAARDEMPVQVAQAPEAATDSEPFQEGKDYFRFAVAQPTSSPPDQVEVAEAFMYSCPHCFAFEPEIARWVAHKPPGVSFVRLPVNFNPVAALHMRAYYAAETLGVLDSIHQAFFDEIHVKKNPLSDVDAITKFFAAHGVDAKTLQDTMSSFAIDARARKTETLLRRYQIASVPTLIINGKYRTDAGSAGGYDRLFQIVEYLIRKEQSEGATAPAP